MEFCSIASGSTGNCIYIGSSSSAVLVDAGISGKKVEEGLNSFAHTAKDLNGILVTHEHSDHIKGLGVLARKTSPSHLCHAWDHGGYPKLQFSWKAGSVPSS